MNHAPDRFVGKEIPHALSIGEIELDETKSFVRRQLGEPGLFQSHIVVVVDIVQADHLVATLQKAHGHMKSDESRCSCDKIGDCVPAMAAPQRKMVYRPLPAFMKGGSP